MRSSCTAQLQLRCPLQTVRSDCECFLQGMIHLCSKETADKIEADLDRGIDPFMSRNKSKLLSWFVLACLGAIDWDLWHVGVKHCITGQISGFWVPPDHFYFTRQQVITTADAKGGHSMFNCPVKLPLHGLTRLEFQDSRQKFAHRAATPVVYCDSDSD